MTYICHDCGEPVNRGEARMRSIMFEQVAFCPDCWASNHEDASVVPSPRFAIDDAPARQGV